MPVGINLFANLLLGAAVAVVVRNSIAFRKAFVSWSLLFLLAFEALVFTPIATYLLRFYPDWSLFYSVDPQIFPRFSEWIGKLSFLCILANFGFAVLGYALIRYGVTRNNRGFKWAPWLMGVLALLICGFVYGERIIVLGDHDVYWQGEGVLLFTRTPGLIGSGLYVSSFLFILWLYSRFRNHDPTFM